VFGRDLDPLTRKLKDTPQSTTNLAITLPTLPQALRQTQDGGKWARQD
jgi:hypothetical protein